MRRIQGSLQVVTATILLGGLLTALPGPAVAGAADDTSLVISQFKVTSHDGQFVTLYNATDSAIDMGKYRLEYFNSYDLDKATSSRLIALSGKVPPHGYYMVNDAVLLLCYRLTVVSASLGFSSTAGMIQVVGFDQHGPGGSAEPVLQDYAAWSKKPAAGALTLPQDTDGFFQRRPADAQGNPQVSAPGAGGWQTVYPDGGNQCHLLAPEQGGHAAPAGPGRLLPPSEPPATVVSAGSGPFALPPADVGLRVPSITELLPNPDGTGNDKTDEFIELYNPNPKPFDLSGFSLQTGTSRMHTYVFPKGSRLPAGAFKSYYSKATGLSLSNASGQARLLDPSGRQLIASGEYEKAKDGMAWALAKGKWRWTVRATPGKANLVQEPASGSGSESSSGTANQGSDNPSVSAQDPAGPDAPSTPIHTRTLVAVAGGALLYGAYEYRADLANRIYRLRQHFGARYEDGF